MRVVTEEFVPCSTLDAEKNLWLNLVANDWKLYTNLIKISLDTRYILQEIWIWCTIAVLTIFRSWVVYGRIFCVRQSLLVDDSSKNSSSCKTLTVLFDSLCWQNYSLAARGRVACFVTICFVSWRNIDRTDKMPKHTLWTEFAVQSKIVQMKWFNEFEFCR